MSEYFFDYKVVNMGGNNEYGLSPDKALEFYSYQDPTANEPMQIQVYIPEKMRKAYHHVDMYMTSDGIELSNCRPKTIYACRTEGSIEENGCLFIQGDDGELSGVGKLEFIRNGETAARPEDTFEFYVNFIKKDVISYRITEKEKKLEIDLVYPLIRKDIFLNVVKKSGAKPLLMCDMDAKLKDKSGKPVHIKLEPRNHNDNAVKVEVDSRDNDKMDAKLVFEDQSLNSYYLLSDVSMDTLEDRKERKDTDAFRMTKRKVCCPFCHKPLVKPNIRIKKKETYVFDCQGAQLYTDNRNLSGSNVLKCTSVSRDFEGKATVVCRERQFLSSFGIGGGFPILPDGYGSEELPAINIATVGFTGSGKSCYLASIYGVTQKSSETAAQANSPVLNLISEVFSKSDNNVKLLKAVLAKDTGSELVTDYSWDNFRTSINDRNVYSRYAINVSGKFESQTKADMDEIKALYENPLGFRVGDLGFVYFYDIPGEVFKHDNTIDDIPMLNIADALIAVIDGDPRTDSDTSAYQTVSDALQHLNTTLSSVISKSKLGESITEMPIAAVLTKCDKRFIENDKAKDPDTYRLIADSCFDPNCHICITNTAEILKSAENTKKYKGSAIKEHIENSSYELEHFFKATGKSGHDSFENIKKNYKNLKFFAVSALGTANAFKAEDDKMKVRFKPRALRTELPVLWLMYQTGLIRE